MRSSHSKLLTPVTLVVPVALLVGAIALGRSSGVQSGVRGVPLQAAQMLPSCGACHTTNPGGPDVAVTVSKLALLQGENATVSVATSGGVPGTNGGFLVEATGGSFTAGANTRVNNPSTSITHSNPSSRSWSFGYSAPNTVGLVELFTVALTGNGGSSSGDQWAFHGFDNTATFSTPVRLFVLPSGVVDVGPGCPDGFGNQSVLGANSAPALGNSNFALELHGTTPGSLGFLLAGFNPPGFQPFDLGLLFGLTGCSGYVANPITLSGLTSPGNAQRGDGSVTFPIPIPNSPAFQGVQLDAQGAYIDPTAVSMLGRSQPVSFSNGLKVTVQ